MYHQVSIKDCVDLADEGAFCGIVDLMIERAGEVEPVGAAHRHCPSTGKIPVSGARLAGTHVPDGVGGKDTGDSTA